MTTDLKIYKLVKLNNGTTTLCIVYEDTITVLAPPAQSTINCKFKLKRLTNLCMEYN